MDCAFGFDEEGDEAEGALAAEVIAFEVHVQIRTTALTGWQFFEKALKSSDAINKLWLHIRGVLNW